MSVAPTTGRTILQTKKQEVVREEIRCACMDLFHATSFDDVTVEQIANRAGISRRTFFRYFSSKEDVLASGVKDYGHALAQVIAITPPDISGIQVAERAVLQVLEPHLVATERAVHIARQSASARSAQLNQSPIVQEDLARAFAVRMNRPAAPHLDDFILANLTLFGTRLSIEIWVDQKHRPFPEIVAEVFARFATVTKH